MQNNAGSVIFSFSHEKETWRVARMMKVYSCIHESCHWLISKMDDHEGELTVTIKKPNKDLADNIAKLWDIQGEVHVKVISE